MHGRLSVRLCSGKTAFEVKVSERIDIQRIAEMLRTKVVTPHIMIGDFNGAEISVYPTGRMLVKRVRTEEEALVVATRLGLH